MVICSTLSAQTASNGLTKVGTDFRLGGTLTQNTTIDLGTSYFFKLSKSTQNYLTVINNGNVGIGLATPSAQLHTTGSVQFNALAGSGSRMVIVDANGLLSTQAIPSGSSSVLPNNYIAVGNGTGISGSTNLQFDASRLYSTKRLEIAAPNNGTFTLANASYVPDMAANAFAELIVGKTESARNRISLAYNHKTDGGLNNEANLVFHSGPSIMRMVSDNIGSVYFNSLKTGATPPPTTGTTKMVIADQNGLLSFADIPGASSLAPTLQSGKIIYVEKDNPGSTDIRTGLSKYSIAFPFKTIQAAVSSSNVWNGDIIYVRTGIYNENVSVIYNNGNAQVFVLDNCIVDGGSGNAFNFTGNGENTSKLYLNNSVLRSSDGSGLMVNTQFFEAYGNSSKTCTISSINGYGFHVVDWRACYFNNISLYSTNNFAVYTPYGGSANTYQNCSIVSTNSTSLRGGHDSFNQCVITGKTGALVTHDMYNFSATNTTITATEGVAISCPGIVHPQFRVPTFLDCDISGASILNVAQGTNTTYRTRFENCRFTVLDPDKTYAFDLSDRGDVAGESVSAYNITTNRKLFSDVFRTSSPGVIKENGININNETNYITANTGFGEQNPTANIHVKGTAILDIPSGTLNANDLVYSKDIATGQMKLVAAPSGSGDGGGVSLPSNQVAYGSTGSTVTGNSNLTFDGTKLLVNGNVGIGTINTNDVSYKLFVETGIRTRKVKVDQATWADYVFEPSYKLPSLEEVESFIKQHKHLPDVPSARDVQKEGLNLGDNQALLLKKIEELTLYAIEQNKKLEKLESKMKKLESDNMQMKAAKKQ